MKHWLLVLLFLVSTLGFAIDDHQLADPEQQKAYELIISELRCLVCQNQTIADSNAELAADLRRQVYEMLQQGKSKDDIVQFMTDRYGDFVLYNPPLQIKTALIWLGQIAFLLTGLIMISWIIRRKKKTEPTIIDKDKQKLIRQLLDDGDQS